MPKKSYGETKYPDTYAKPAGDILECTPLFEEALDDLNLEYSMLVEENQEAESAARKALGLDPVPGKISEALA